MKTLTYSQLEHLQQSVNELTVKVETAIKKLTKLESYFYKDEEADSMGIIKQVKQNTQRIDELERTEVKTRKFLKWLAVAAGAAGTIIFEFIKWIFSNHKP